MEIKEVKIRYEEAGGGAGPFFITAAAEAEVECDDGQTVYVALTWFSEEPDILGSNISETPNIDDLVYTEYAVDEEDDAWEEDEGDEEDVDEESMNEATERAIARFGSLSDKDKTKLLNELRLAISTRINEDKFYHGKFGEDAFTEGWTYDED